MSKLDTSDPEIAEKITEILDAKTPTDWCIFGLVPKTSKLRLNESGSKGLSELKDEFSDGSIHFAFIRFPVSETYKFVFVSWCGGGVQGMMKGSYTAWSKDMEVFMKQRGRGYHVQIDARSTKDLNEKQVIEKINKAKGANFIVAKTSTEDKGPALKDQSSSYWKKQATVDESHSKEMEEKAKRREEALVKAREAHSQRLTSEASAKLRQIESSREAQNLQRRQEAEIHGKQDQERRDKTAQDVLRRVQESKGGPVAEYGTAYKGTAAAPAHNVYHAQEPAQSSTYASYNAPNPNRVTLQPANAPSFGATASKAAMFSQPPQQAAPVAQKAPAPQKAKPAPPPASSKPVPPPASSKPKSYTPPPPPPPAQEEEWEEPQQQWEEPQQQQWEEPQQQQWEEPPQQQWEEPEPEPEQQWEEEQQQQPAQDAGWGEDAGTAGTETDQYTQLRALYDYPGEQDGDLAFGEGDLILLIDSNDPSGWWEGELNGVRGFFPSNFVEYV